MERRPDLVTVLVLIFSLGVLFTGFTAIQANRLEAPVLSQMDGVSLERAPSFSWFAKPN